MSASSTWLKSMLLSPKAAIIAGCLALLLFLVAVSDSILEPMFYGISYALGHAQSGMWTDVQARDVIWQQLRFWLPDLLLPMIVIVWTTAKLLGLRRKFHLKYTER